MVVSDTVCTAPSTPCETFTIEGNANGATCQFPFIYKDVLYYQCIGNDHKGRLWCSTTYNYDVDQKWGNCAGMLCKHAHTSLQVYCLSVITCQISPLICKFDELLQVHHVTPPVPWPLQQCPAHHASPTRLLAMPMELFVSSLFDTRVSCIMNAPV